MNKVKTKQVSIENDIKVTAKFGGITDFDDGKQYKTIKATDSLGNPRGLDEILEEILTKRIMPTVTAPTITLNAPKMKAYEVGSRVTPQYSIVFHAGSYSYGPATGIAATSYAVAFNGASKTSELGQFSEVVVTDDMNLTMTALAHHSAGATPLDNLDDGQESMAIAEGTTAQVTSAAITGFRSYFCGAVTDSGSLTSAIVRGLTNSGKAYSATTLTVRAVSGAKKLVVAVPHSAGATLNRALLTTSMNADVTSEWIKTENALVVEGVDGYTGVAYDVWVYAPASIDAGEVHSITMN